MRFLLASFALVLLPAFHLSFANNDEPVTCGSVVKINHVEFDYNLHSESKNLNSGSGQQLITFVKDKGSHDDLWWIRPAHHNEDIEYTSTDSSCQLGQPIPCGSLIRLTHLPTMKNLHSHGVQSPLTRQQEVTAFGEGDGKGDGGDDWFVECKTKTWHRDSTFRLLHKDTEKYLGTSTNAEFNQQTCGPQCPIMGHLEAFCRAAADKHSEMKVEQGFHITK